MEYDKKGESLTSVNDKIALMEIYREEWKYRDQTFESYFWRFVYLSLIITFLPDFLKAVGSTPEIMQSFPSWVFPAAGIVCSLLGIYLGFAENRRIRSIDTAYKKLLKSLTKRYLVEEYEKSYLKIRLNLFLCVVVYLITITLAVINLCVI